MRSPESPAVQDLLRYVSMSVVAVAHDLPWKSGVGGPCGRGAAGWASIGAEKAWLLVVGCCSLVSFASHVRVWFLLIAWACLALLDSDRATSSS